MEPTPDLQDTTTEQEMDAAFDVRDQLHAIELQVMRYLDEIDELNAQAWTIREESGNRHANTGHHTDERRAWAMTHRHAAILTRRMSAVIGAWRAQ